MRADLKPEWQPGRIIRRNGVRTLTIQSETKPDILPSELLKEIRPALAKMELPEGYRIKFGGEYANKNETFNPMITALLVSLIIIFMVLI